MCEFRSTKFDPVSHISTRQNTLTKEISSKNLGLPRLDSVKILDAKLFPLFTQTCCETIRRELSLFHKQTNQLLGPSLRDCKKALPFTYEAVTNCQVSKVISSIAGFDLQICVDNFEISQFASRDTLSDNYTNISSWRQIPYTFVCLVPLDQDLNNDLNKLSMGMATILEGKLMHNLSQLQISSSKSPPKDVLNLTIVMTPSNIIDFENQKILLKLGSEAMLKIAYYSEETQNAEDFEKCASWLDKHYDKLLSN